MLLVTRADVEGLLNRSLTVDEDARFDHAARSATAHLRAVAPRIPDVQPVPDAVAGVAAELVAASLASPPAGGGDVQSEALGGYSVTYRSGGRDALTASQRVRLTPWRRPRIGTVRIDPVVAGARS